MSQNHEIPSDSAPVPEVDGTSLYWSVPDEEPRYVMLPDSHMPTVTPEKQAAIDAVVQNPNVGIRLFMHSQFGDTNGYSVKYEKKTEQLLPEDLSEVANRLLRTTGGAPHHNLHLDEPILAGRSIIMKKQLESGLVYVLIMHSPIAPQNRGHVGLSVAIPAFEHLDASCEELEADPSLWLRLFQNSVQKADRNVVTHSYPKVIPAPQLADDVTQPSWVPEANVDKVLERATSRVATSPTAPPSRSGIISRFRKHR